MAEGEEVTMLGKALAKIYATFLSLLDTPSSYSGQGGKYVKVNTGETGLEFGAGAELVVNVKNYGAVGDGVVDDTVAINNAKNALGNIKTLFFPAGTYIISSSISISTANCTIFGEGNSSIIKLKDASGIADYSTLIYLNANGITVRDICIDGNSANNSYPIFNGIGFTGKDDITIQRIKVIDVTFNGILAYATTTANNRIIVELCNVYNAGNTGIILYYCKNTKILKNNIISTGGDSIHEASGTTPGTHDNDTILIQGNYINRAVAPTVLCRLFGSEWGFMININGKNITITENTCWDNRTAANDGIGLGMYSGQPHSGVVISNNIVGYAGLFGIDATNKCTVTGNYIYKPASYGMVLAADLLWTYENITITGNVIIDPLEGGSAGYMAAIAIYALAVGAGSTIRNVIISNNVINDTRAGKATEYAIAMDNTYATISDFRITNNWYKGIKTKSINFWGTLANYSDIVIKDNTDKDPFIVFSYNDDTPSVLAGEIFKCSNTAATTVTSFDNGYTGQEIEIVFTTANTTITETGNIKLQGTISVNPSANDAYRFRFDGLSWFQIGGGGSADLASFGIDGGAYSDTYISTANVDAGAY